jgi:hypothetical protein
MNFGSSFLKPHSAEEFASQLKAEILNALSEGLRRHPPLNE